MAQAKRDENFVTSTLLVGSTGETFPWEGDEATGRAYVDIAGGAGTVTSVSVVTANGFAGSVATATTTPAITLSTTVTGILYGNGTSVAAATGGQLPVMTSTVGGAVPTPPNNTTTFLRGDGTFAAPAGSGNVSNTGTPLNNQVAVWTDATTIEGDADLTFDTATNTLSTGILNSSTLTASEIVLTDASKNLVSAAVATYPSLTELTYLKGVTSAIQTQLNAKQATITFGTGVQTALGVNIGSAGAFVVFDGALGTPSSGTVTNLTGTASININGTVGATTPTTGVFTTLVAGSTTSLLLGTAGSAVGNIGFRNATSGTITLAPVTGALGTVTLTLPAVTDTVAAIAATQTLTNKRITRRSSTTNAPGATPTTNSDNVDLQIFTGLATAITSMTTNLSGTPVRGDFLEFNFTDDGTGRGITWGASFAATTVPLPTTTVASTLLRVLFERGPSTWDCVAVA